MRCPTDRALAARSLFSSSFTRGHPGGPATRLRAGLVALALLAAAPLGRAQGSDPLDEVSVDDVVSVDETPPLDAPRRLSSPKAPLVPKPPPKPPERVIELRVLGTERVPEERVRALLETRPGERLDAERLREDLRRLYALGVFESLEVRALFGTGGVVLELVAGERATLRRVRFVGLAKLSRDQVNAVIDLTETEVVDEPRLAQNAEKIRELYRQAGYPDARVRWVLEEPTPAPDPERSLQDLAKDTLSFLLKPVAGTDTTEAGERASSGAVLLPGEGGRRFDVAFFIDEGVKVRIQRIAFEGNESFSDDELLALMRTKRHLPIADLLGWGVYRQESLAMDRMALEAFYQDRGFLEVKVTAPKVTLSPDRSRARVRVVLEEGPRYRVGTVELAGDLIDDSRAARPSAVHIPRALLLTRLGLGPGAIAGRSALSSGVNAVADLYRNRGYAYVNVDVQPRLDREQGRFDLRLMLEAGPRVTIERIEIVGNDKTRDEVIRRELRVFEGEPYSAEALRRSEARVRALGYFGQVRVTSRQGSRPDRMVLTLDVEEKNTGLFQLGAGYSNAENFMINGQVRYDNFLGTGRSLGVAGQLSSIRRVFDVRLEDPYLFTFGAEPLAASFRAYNTQRGFAGFLRNATGTNLTLGYPVGRPFRALTDRLAEGAPLPLRPFIPDLENLRLVFGVGAERVTAQSLFEGAWLGTDKDRPRYSTGLEAALIFDQRNNRLFPTAGYYLDVRAELTSPFFGASLLPGLERAGKSALFDAGLPNLASALSDRAVANDFIRFSSTARVYVPLDAFLPVRGIVAKANLQFGYLQSDALMPFENYFLGGIGSVRGYFPFSLAPVLAVPGVGSDARTRFVQVGGDKQALLNLELEFPLLEVLGIRGVLFADAGNTFGQGERFFYLGQKPADPSAPFDPVRDLPLGLYTSVGFGIRWFSPIGPLRFEWGVPLTPRPAGTPGLRRGDEPVMFEFNIGNSF